MPGGFLRLILFAARCDAGALPVPGVATLGIESLGTAVATLTGEGNPHGLATDAWFEWGTDPALASPTATAAVSVGDGVVPGQISLREAVEIVAPDGTITSDIRLDDARIYLSIVGEPISTLRGEVFTMSAGSWVFGGYQERNHGASALYAAKSLSPTCSGTKSPTCGPPTP